METIFSLRPWTLGWKRKPLCTSIKGPGRLEKVLSVGLGETTGTNAEVAIKDSMCVSILGQLVRA